jgi:PAS domain S-box-containing protein
MKFQNLVKEEAEKNSLSTIDENKVERKIEMLPAIVDSSDDAIIGKTLEGTIISWNPAATRLFGYEEKEALGKNISMLIPSDAVVGENMISEKIRKGEKVQNLEATRVSRDG